MKVALGIVLATIALGLGLAMVPWARLIEAIDNSKFVPCCFLFLLLGSPFFAWVIWGREAARLRESIAEKQLQEEITRLEELARSGDPIALEQWKRLTEEKPGVQWFFFWKF